MFCAKLFLFSKEAAHMAGSPHILYVVLLLQYAVLNLTINMLVFTEEHTLFLVVLVGFELDITNVVLTGVEVLCVLHS